MDRGNPRAFRAIEATAARWKKVWVSGAPLELRLILAGPLAGWQLVGLLSNVPHAVDAGTLAQWYYWRWRVESYFKLLSLDLEQWGQETAAAVARRLLVASMACVVVWHIARSQHPKAEAARQSIALTNSKSLQTSPSPTPVMGPASELVSISMGRETVPQQRSP